MTYKIAQGFDVALDDMQDIIFQPSSQGMKSTRRSWAADGSPKDEGLYIELEFSALGSAEEYQDLLDQFNILSYSRAPVTIYARSQVLAFTRYNGYAIQPEIGKDIKWSDFFPRDITILIRNLDQLVESP